MATIESLITLILAQTDIRPSPTSVGFELSIWKWVVIIAAGAFVTIFLIKRIADIVTRQKTARIINEVVGQGESKKHAEWKDDEISEED